MRKIIVEENEAMRLDKLVAVKCEDLSRTRLQKLITEEKILVNGRPRESVLKSKKWRYDTNRRNRNKRSSIKITKYTIRYYLWRQRYYCSK